MARKVIAVEPADDDRMTFYVFCDDGTVWSWVAPRHRKKLNRGPHGRRVGVEWRSVGAGLVSAIPGMPADAVSRPRPGPGHRRAGPLHGCDRSPPTRSRTISAIVFDEFRVQYVVRIPLRRTGN